MKIILTRAQWENLYAIVNHGKQCETALGRPTEIVNSDQKIEITDDEVKIILAD